MTAFEVISTGLAVLAIPSFVYSMIKLFSENMRHLNEKRQRKIEADKEHTSQKKKPMLQTH